MSQFSCGGLLPLKRIIRITWRTLFKLHSFTHSHNSYIFLTGTLFPRCEFINHAPSPVWPLLETLLACDSWHSWFCCTYHTSPLVLSFLGNSSQLIFFNSRVWILAHAFFYIIQSLRTILSTYCQSFNYHQSTDISQTYHYSTNNNLQISIPNHLLILSPKMIHKFQN